MHTNALAFESISVDLSRHLDPPKQRDPNPMEDPEWEDMSDMLFGQLRTIPREIRDLIYQFALTESGDILVTPTSRHEAQRVAAGQSIPNKPALLSVCHQVRHEATEVYYAVNTFRAIISDDDTYKAPFVWISQLSDHESKSVGQLIVEFKLSDATRRGIFNAIHDYTEAMRVNAIRNAGIVDPVHQLQASQQLQLKLQDIVKVNILNSITAEMRLVYGAGRFDLSRISFEVTDTSHCFQACKIWRNLLEQCLKATRDGKHLEFESARTTVASV